MRAEVRKICLEAYQSYVRNMPFPNELKRALKAHERVPAFIDNLAEQFSKPGLKISRDTMVSAVHDLTNLFVSCVGRQAEERLTSPLAKAVKLAEIDRKKEIDRQVDLINEGGKEYVTQDKAGNETIHQVVNVEKVLIHPDNA